MKSIRNILTAAAIAVTAATASSCYVRISDEAKKDLKNALELRLASAKEVYSESDSVVFRPGAFTSVSSMGSMDVEFILSDGEPVVSVFGTHITRDSVKVYVNDGKLVIDTNSPIMYDESVRIYGPAVSAIETRGSGDFTGTLEGESVEAVSLGSGDLNLNIVNVINLNVSSSGSGDVVLRDKAAEAIITMTGSGDLDALKLDAAKITATSHGSGDLLYKKDGIVVSE